MLRKNIKNNNFKLGFNKFKKELKKEGKIIFIVLFIQLFAYISPAIIPIIIGKLVDSIIHPTLTTFLNITLDSAYFFFIIFSILKFLERYLDILSYDYYITKISNNIYINYSKQVFSKLLSFPLSFFKKESLGKITYATNTGAEKLSNIIHSLPDMLGFPLMILLNSFFLFFISAEAGILILFGNIIAIIYFYITIEGRKKVTGDFNEEKKKISNFITENINLSIEVKKNSNEEKEKKILKNKFNTTYNNKFKKLLFFRIKKDLFNTTLFYLIFSLLWVLIIYLYRNNSITEGDIMAINMYAMHIGNNINWFIKQLNEFVEGFTIIGDTEKLIQKSIPENYSNNKISKEILGDIKFKNVNFKYEIEQDFIKENEKGEKNLKKKKIFSLTNINLNIKKGQKVAFVGESGGGKTTSVDLIGGFYFPDVGEISIDNIPTTKWNLNQLRNSIAYVSQDIAIFNSTIGENISYGTQKDVNIKEIKKAAKLANIDKFIENLPDEYSTKVGEKGLKLSGGQKQRIAIARAILRNPEILILDEPTSALDIVSEKYITKSLEELMKGRTTIIIAHRLSTIADADNIFVFKNGKIVENGNYNSLISQNGEFKRMVDLHEEIK